MSRDVDSGVSTGRPVSEADGRTTNGNSDAAMLVEEPSTLNREDIFSVLSNERRRLVLRYLRSHDKGDRVDFTDLVDQVAAWENGTACGKVDSKDRKCVYTALRQTHLPSLDSLGVVDFDNRRGDLRLETGAADVFQYMDHTPERTRRWGKIYLTVAVVCGTIALLIEGSLIPLSGVPTTGLGIGIALVFGAVAIAQLYRTSRMSGGQIRPLDATLSRRRMSTLLSTVRTLMQSQFREGIEWARRQLYTIRSTAAWLRNTTLEMTPGLSSAGGRRNVLAVFTYFVVLILLFGNTGGG